MHSKRQMTELNAFSKYIDQYYLRNKLDTVTLDALVPGEVLLVATRSKRLLDSLPGDYKNLLGNHYARVKIAHAVEQTTLHLLYCDLGLTVTLHRGEASDFTFVSIPQIMKL